MNSYKVGILLSGYPYLFYNKNNELEGIIYNSWKQIKSKLDYNFQEIIINKDNLIDFDKQIDSFDIVIGLYSSLFITDSFDKTIPFFLTKSVFIYNEEEKKELSILEDIENKTKFLQLTFKIGLQPFLLLLFLGIILGIFVYITNRDRGFFDSIYTVFVTLLQEPGRLIDRKRPHIFNNNIFHLILVLLVLTISFFFAMYIQAKTTAAMVYAAKINTSYDTTFINSINEKMIITLPIPQITNHLQSNNIKYKIYNILSNDTILKELDNGSVDAAIIDSIRADELVKTNNYFISSYPLGYVTQHILINKKHPKVLSHTNTQIQELSSTNYIRNVCESYNIINTDLCNI